jgi:hypothetical protein
VQAQEIVFIGGSRAQGEVLPAQLMPLLFVLVAMLAPAQPPQPAPITVIGHPWAPFISPMGEPFRAHTPTDDTLADWFRKADRNGDGLLTADEMQADAERFFAKLDTDHDGEIGPDEISAYEYQVAPEIQAMSRTRRPPGQPAPVTTDSDDNDSAGDRTSSRHRRHGEEVDASLGLAGALQGAARYSLLNMPEPVAAADTDFNRSITLDEFRQAAIARFDLLDSAHRGSLTLTDLKALPHAPSTDKHRSKRDRDALDTRIGNPLPSGP